MEALVLVLSLMVAATLPGVAQESPTPKGWPSARFATVLSDLSSFARQVDSGERTLARAHAREGQPDGMMTELRALVHEYPALGPAFLKYVRSNDEPLMARALAVLALSQPRTSEVAATLGDFFSDPPDLKLAKIAGLGYEWTQETRGGREWSVPLDLLGHAGAGPEWRMPQQTISKPMYSSTSAPGKVDLSPMLEGMLKLLQRPAIGDMRPLGMGLVWEFSGRTHASPEQKARVRDLMARSYASRDDGWSIALEYFTSRRRLDDTDLEVLKNGFPGLEGVRQLQVLDEIFRNFSKALFEPPFREALGGAVKLLSQPSKESGLPLGTHSHLVHALKVNEDPKIQELLANPSPMLKERLAGWR